MAHIHEKIDFTASVYIVLDDRVLLHMHKKLNKWLQPGVHVELDEDPNEAALREVREETGLEVELVGRNTFVQHQEGSKDLTVPTYLNRHHFSEAHEHIDFTYFGRVLGGELQAEDGVELRWFNRKEIEQNDVGMYDVTREHALSALTYFEQK